MVQKSRSLKSVPPTGIKYASIEDVDELAQGWSDDTLVCRSFGHSPDPLTFAYNEEEEYWLVVLRCRRCGFRRNQEVSAKTGNVFGRWPNYPPGYLAKKKGRVLGPAKDYQRLITIMRVAEKQATKAKKVAPAKTAKKAAPAKPSRKG